MVVAREEEGEEAFAIHPRASVGPSSSHSHFTTPFISPSRALSVGFRISSSQTALSSHCVHQQQHLDYTTDVSRKLCHE